MTSTPIHRYADILARCGAREHRCVFVRAVEFVFGLCARRTGNWRDPTAPIALGTEASDTCMLISASSKRAWHLHSIVDVECNIFVEILNYNVLMIIIINHYVVCIFLNCLFGFESFMYVH